MKVLSKENDGFTLQNYLDRIQEWIQQWDMEFNANKCKPLEFRRSMKKIRCCYKLVSKIINKAKEEKDFTVTFQDDRSPQKHHKIVGLTYKLLINFRNTFTNLIRT